MTFNIDAPLAHPSHSSFWPGLLVVLVASLSASCGKSRSTGDSDGGNDGGLHDAAPSDAGSDVDGGEAADPGPWTSIAVAETFTGALPISGDLEPARGTAPEWLPILAVTDEPDTVEWVAGIGFSGPVSSHGVGGRALAAVDPASRDVYVAFTVRAVDGPDPMTVELSGPGGSIGARTTTFADVSGRPSSSIYFETFLAKLGGDGSPRWVKRLAQGTGDAQGTSTLTRVVNAEGDRVMVVLVTNARDESEGTVPLTIGPGDPEEVVLDVPRNQRVQLTILLDPATGALEDLDLLADRAGNGGVESSWSFASPGMVFDEVGRRYGNAASWFGSDEPDVAYSLEGGVAVAVPRPGLGSGFALWGTYEPDDLTVDFNQAAAGGEGSSAGAGFSYPLSDGGLLASLGIGSPEDVVFSSGSGPQRFEADPDETEWLVRYDRDGDVIWAKSVLVRRSTPLPAFFWGSALDDPANDAVFVYGRVWRASALVLGVGEPGEDELEMSPAFPSGVLARYDRNTGELVWARLLEQLSTPTAALSGALFRRTEDGALELRLTASGDVSMAGVPVALGTDASSVRLVVDEGGAVVSTDVMLSFPTTARVSRFVTDVLP